MDRHFKCRCGGTAWITREEHLTTIECASCGLITSGETLTLAKAEWQLRENPKKDPKSSADRSASRREKN